MAADEHGSRPDDEVVVEVISSQLQHFRDAEPPCRGMQLPDGILLRHTRSSSLYFYLKTAVENGRINTQVYASDSPYERQKAHIGVVSTSMFEPRADPIHLEKLERTLRDWVAFVRPDPDGEGEFDPFYFDQDNR